jgi:hypothetical protein
MYHSLRKAGGKFGRLIFITECFYFIGAWTFPYVYRNSGRTDGDLSGQININAATGRYLNSLLYGHGLPLVHTYNTELTKGQELSDLPLCCLNQ